MTSPIVSVIIPCYNAEKNLMQCIESICSQTLEQMEIICVDDGSTDSTLEILHSYQEKDPRIRVIQQKNAGAGAARNVGLDCASGEYLSFLDADDFFEPDMLEKAVAAAEKWQADYIVFHADRYYSAQNRYEEMPWSVRDEDLPPYIPFSYRQLTDNIFLSFVGWAWDKLFRRSFVLEHQLRFQEQRTTNDMLFVFSALICAKRIGVIQDVLAHQRRGSGDTLSVTREKSWHCFYDALLALRERLLRENIYWELEKDFINYSLHFCLWHLNSLAEPSHTLLKQKLCSEWFAELGIADKPESYFYNYWEYAQFLKIAKKRDGVSRRFPQENRSPGSAGFDWSLFQINQDGNTEILANREAVYAENVKFDHLRDRLMQDWECWQNARYLYWRRKYDACQFVSRHLDPSVKGEYQKRMSREFKRAMQLNEIRKEDFSIREWLEIQRMVGQSYKLTTRIRKCWLVRKLLPAVPERIRKKAAILLKRTVRSE